MPRDDGSAPAVVDDAVQRVAPPHHRRKLSRDKLLVLLLGIPGALALVLFHYLPLLGNVIAFQDYQPYLGFTESEWVGFSNFSFLWDGNPEFLNALWNTVILTVIQTVLVFPVPLALALL